MATSLTISILTDVSKAVAGINSIDQKTTSWGSKMMGVAGAIGGVFSISKVKDTIEGWLNAGMDASRALKDVKVTFGDAGAGVATWADETGKAFGMTASEAEKAAAKVGIALEGYGLSQSDAAKASEELVQRSADIAKVMGVDQAEVLSKVETAMRGRTAGLKDYGVQVDKGASSTDILNGFLDQTAKFAGQADTPMGELHATMGNLQEVLGTALLPLLKDVLPLFQGLADWAKNNKVAFEAIVFTFTAMALIFGIAATVAGILAVAEWSVLWPALLIVAAIAALVVVVVLVIKYWGTLVGWYHTAASAIQGVIDKLGPLIFLFGPLGVAIGVVETLAKHWDTVKGAVNDVYNAIKKVIDIVGTAADKVGSFLSHLPHVPGLPFSAPAPGAGPSSYGASSYAAPVTFSPTITINGDIGDPTLAGRRIVAALESWAAANGRRRIAALVAP